MVCRNGVYSMRMTDFGKPMADLGNAYRGRFAVRPDDSDDVKVSVLATWFKYLGEFELEDFENAVDAWIREEDAPPTVKTLRLRTLKQKWRREGLE